MKPPTPEKQRQTTAMFQQAFGEMDKANQMALLNEQWISWPGELVEILNSALIVVPNIVTFLEILSNKELLDVI